MEEKNNGIKIAEHFRVEQSYDEYEKNIEEAHKNEISSGTDFQESLEESSISVEIIARYLNKKGHGIYINPNGGLYPVKKKDSTNLPRQCNSDGGDLYYGRGDLGDGGIFKRVEVKGLTCDFTKLSNYPKKYRSDGHIAVCRKVLWENYNPPPSAFYLLNKKKTHAIEILNESFKYLIDKAAKKDGTIFKRCPVERVKFIELNTDIPQEKLRLYSRMVNGISEQRNMIYENKREALFRKVHHTIIDIFKEIKDLDEENHSQLMLEEGIEDDKF